MKSKQRSTNYIIPPLAKQLKINFRNTKEISNSRLRITPKNQRQEVATAELPTSRNPASNSPSTAPHSSSTTGPEPTQIHNKQRSRNSPHQETLQKQGTKYSPLTPNHNQHKTLGEIPKLEHRVILAWLALNCPILTIQFLISQLTSCKSFSSESKSFPNLRSFLSFQRL
jgi:hypothetical protein